MYYVYVLFNGKIKYVGYTSDLKRRLREHQTDKVEATKLKGHWELIFYEAFKEETKARKRELYFKTTKGKRALKLMLGV